MNLKGNVMINIWGIVGILLCGISSALTGLFLDWVFGTGFLVWTCAIFGMIGGLLFQHN
jgi:hypothetical protein